MARFPFLRALASLFLSASALAAHANTNTYAVAPEAREHALPALRGARAETTALAVRLPAPGPEALEKTRAANDGPQPKRLRIGIGRDVSTEANGKSGRLAWRRVPHGGWVGHWRVASEGAAAIRVALGGTLPAGAEVRFTGTAADAPVYGPFAASLVASQSPYWGPVIEGSEALVEVFLPDGTMPAETSLALHGVSHLYVSPAGRLDEVLPKASGACQVDLACKTGADPALAVAARSVARMSFLEGGFSYLCTGTLLNPTGTQIPYFYSANHCIDSQVTANTLTTHWFYDRSMCGGGGTAPGYVQLPGGAELKYAHAASDALLLRLNGTPPAGAVYLGWNASSLANNTELVGIHHPSGDWKKVSRGSFTGNATLPPGFPGGSFLEVHWMEGVTEPGSSGSGIFAAVGFPATEYRLRGGLWGGGSSCENPSSPDYYSRFDQVFPAVAQWLNPPTTPVVCSYALSRTGISVSAAAESGDITVTPSPSSCKWRAASGSSWITLTGTGTDTTDATGTATFNYSIAANNSTAARNGIITVADTSVAVVQSAATVTEPQPSCDYTLSPAIRSIDAAKRTGTVTVATTAGCAWVPVSDAAWLQTSGSGTSAGTFTYSVQANTSPGPRTATVTVGDKTFTLLQAEPGAQPPVPPGTPAVGLSEAAFDLGRVSMGTTSGFRELIVTNTGGGALTVSTIQRAGGVGHSTNCITLFGDESCLINVYITAPIADGALNSTTPIAGTLTINSDAPGSPHHVAVTATAEKSLVTHYYGSILRRIPDTGGRAYWESEAARLAGLGANVNETWYAMAQAFFSSAEYLAFARNDSGYVSDLYRTFFNRTADTAGLNYWNGLLGQGMPREVVLVSFMISPEFSSFATAIFGNTQARAEVDTAGDFFRGLLSRLPDTGGLGYWVQRFRTAQCSGGDAVYAEVESISSGFANSPEYGARNRSNSQFVGDMYNAFMRRGGDLAGVQYWISQLDSGARTRDNVRRAFISTPEFNARVQAVIAAGCLP